MVDTANDNEDKTEAFIFRAHEESAKILRNPKYAEANDIDVAARFMMRYSRLKRLLDVNAPKFVLWTEYQMVTETFNEILARMPNDGKVDTNQ